MNANFACPHCEKHLALDQQWLGRKIQCPFCNSVFLFNEEILGTDSPRRELPAGAASALDRLQPPGTTVAFEAEPIGFWARVGASFIDGCVIGGASLLIGFLGGVVLGVAGVDGQEWEDCVGCLNLLDLAGAWLYEALMVSSGAQATLGKLVIGAKVVGPNGGRLSFGRATGRHFAKVISTLTFGVGYIMVAFSARKRGLHDLIAGTYVVSRR